jgi:serine acetyltransferase
MVADFAITWRQTRERLCLDARRLRAFQLSKFGYRPLTWFADPSWVCVFLHRLSHLAWSRGWRKLGRLLMQLNSLSTGADIHPDSDLGGGLLIPTPSGVTISGKAGRNLAMLALSGLGGSNRDHDIGAGAGLPVVGDNVIVNQFGGIQGAIRVGRGIVVAPGAAALKDVADGSEIVLASAPERGRLPPPLRRRDPPEPCGHAGLRVTWRDFCLDLVRFLDELAEYRRAPPGFSKRLSVALTNPSLALLVYRTSHWLWLNGYRRLAGVLCRLNLLVAKLTIPPASCLAGGAFVPHLAGTVFCGRAGTNFTLYANSLCASEGGGWSAVAAAAPVLGDGVTIGGHSGIYGSVAIGDGVRLAPNVQVAQDIAAGMQAFSPMARYAERKAKGVPRPDDATGARPERLGAYRLPRELAWRETRLRLRQDRARLRQECPQSAALTQLPRFPALTCVRLYRYSHFFHATGRRRAARWCWLVNVYLTGADIAPGSEIGGGLLIPHPAGVAVHGRAGCALTLLAQSGIGAPLGRDGRWRGLDEAPRLGHSVHLAHHSGVYGPVSVGDRVRVCSGCIADRQVENDATLVSRPLRLRRINAGAGTPPILGPPNDDPGPSEQHGHERDQTAPKQGFVVGR